MKRIYSLYLITILWLVLTPNLDAQHGRTPAPAKKGMVVSSHFLASQVGKKVLQDGGNAMDAAVATEFALAVTLPSAGNIGGGGFIVYHGADGTVTSFNFREKAPLAAFDEMYLGEDGKIKNNSNKVGALSVGVPGTVAGLYLAHSKLGSKEWKDLVAPSVQLAKKGFPSTWAMQPFLKIVQENKERYPSTAKAFLKDGQQLYEPGELWKQPDLAATLKRIQKNGSDGFYKGETARLLAEFMEKNQGMISLEDLEKYEAQELEPIHGSYRGYDIYSMPPPSSGGITLVGMLNILEGYDLKLLGHNSARYLHLLTEAMRRAYANRAEFLGDPDFNPELPKEKLISKQFAEELRNSIDPAKASPSDSSRFASVYLIPESEETTHLSVVDKNGNAISLTYTLEASYGSKMVVEGAGFLLNNEMGDFNAIPGLTNSKGKIGTKPNLVEPGKRMLSSMTPTIVAKDGKPVLVIGSPGGRTIINTVLQVILNVIDHEMDIAQAIEASRIHHQWLPDVTSFEEFGISKDTKELFESMGHPIKYRKGQGAAMGIFIDYEKDLLFGGSDSRSFDSGAVGY